MNGLMIETHPDPDYALSDADQQITPQQLQEIKKNLKPRDYFSEDVLFQNQLDQLRRMIDSIDKELLQILSKRMHIVEKIGDYKKNNNVTIFQLQRWHEILTTRSDLAKNLYLNEDFVKRILQEIHKESIQVQTEILQKLMMEKSA